MNKKIILIPLIILIFTTLFFSLQKPQPITENPLPNNNTVLADVKTETICTDKIDNDEDGLIDNEDGDCWIKEGPIYETHPYYYPNHSFKEITNDIPRIADLGAKTIYILPIWHHEPLPAEGKKYRYGMIYHILDYYSISPEFGTEQELKEIVDTAHQYGTKVIFDLVTCCTFEDSVPYKRDWVLETSLSELKAKKISLDYKIIDDIKYVYSNCDIDTNEGLQSKCDLLGRIDGDKVKLFIYPSPGYGYATDKTNPKAIEYFVNAAKYYVEEYGIDGWRIDAPANAWNPHIVGGDHSALPLLRKAKQAISEIKPEAVFLSEHSSLYPLTENPAQHFDEISEISYGTNLYEQLPFLIKNTIPGDLIKALADERVEYNRARLRFTETHDYPRVNTIPNLSKPTVVLISTIPGVPMIQAGQEIGAAGKFTSDAPVNWLSGDREMEMFYEKVFSVRNTSNPLKYGDIKNVWKSGDNVFAYSRTYENETAVVAINFQDKAATSVLNLPFKSGTVLSDELNNENLTVSDPSNFMVSVPAYGSKILTIKR